MSDLKKLDNQPLLKHLLIINETIGGMSNKLDTVCETLVAHRNDINALNKNLNKLTTFRSIVIFIPTGVLILLNIVWLFSKLGVLEWFAKGVT